MDEGLCSFERLGKHTGIVMCVSVFMGSDGTNQIVSGSIDNTLKVWNAESCRVIIRQLQDKIRVYETKMRYTPGGEGYFEAKQDFEHKRKRGED